MNASGKHRHPIPHASQTTVRTEDGTWIARIPSVHGRVAAEFRGESRRVVLAMAYAWRQERAGVLS